ncbi:MAG: metal ABC transporter permease [Acidimicrobiia bacterium]|nr:metal ABC transporter permease [Acidimicrobiia bacterium]
MTSLLASAATPRPSWNVVHDVHQLFSYAFMRHAFVAGTIVAVLAGAVGYFVVLRQSAFAAHSMSEIGFAGASGAVAFGFSAVLGLLGMSLAGAVVIGLLGTRLRGRDAAIGTVLVFSLGLGSYFITRYKGESASGPFGLLFGEILGISVHDIWFIGVAAVVTLVALAVIYRPLLFASLDEDVAESRGVPVRGLSVGFLLVLAVAVTAAVQVVGVLLIFALLVTPGAIADRVCRTPARAMALCVALALLFVWAGLSVTYYSRFPVGFLIAAFAFVGYLVARVATGLGQGAARARHPDAPPPVNSGRSRGPLGDVSILSPR